MGIPLANAMQTTPDLFYIFLSPYAKMLPRVANRLSLERLESYVQFFYSVLEIGVMRDGSAAATCAGVVMCARHTDDHLPVIQYHTPCGHQQAYQSFLSYVFFNFLHLHGGHRSGWRGGVDSAVELGVDNIVAPLPQ